MGDVTNLPTNGVEARLRALEESARESRQRTGSSLGLMSSWAGVVLGIVGLVGGIVSGGLMRELDRQDTERVALDGRLQREMRDLDTTSQASIAAAELMASERANADGRRLADLEAWRFMHTEFISERIGMLLEQTRSLERAVFDSTK
jgi:hypothetical protein